MRGTFFVLMNLLVSFLLLDVYAAEKGQVKALLVIDTSSNLSSGLKKNKEMMLSVLQFVSAAAKLSLNATVLEEQEVRVDNVRCWLDGLRMGKEDIVLFYFAGHGAEDANSKWPMLNFSTELTLLPLKKVVERMKEIHPRLFIVFSDCCNSSPYSPIPNLPALMPKWAQQIQGHARPLRRVEQKLLHVSSAKQMQNLFPGIYHLMLKKRGGVVLTGATKGEVAIAFLQAGGLSTWAFYVSLFEQSRNKKLSWKEVLFSCKDLCSPIQTPCGSISLSSHR